LVIFNNEGNLLYKSEEKINNNHIIYSYSITFIHVTNDTCDYAIGYFDEDSYLNISLYRYDNKKNNIKFLTKYKKNNYRGVFFEFAYKQKLITCEYMYFIII
jgi:hypothetical protein